MMIVVCIFILFVFIKIIEVDGVNVFYCEVGFVDVLVILLLYGFFLLLYMFCELILCLVL